MIAQEPAQTRLQVKKIVLYKHGVGYFERHGTVAGSTTVPLTFKTDEMKDALKSLYAVDMGEGRIGSILYDSKEPIEKQLEDIRFRVPEASALTEFMTQLKGARVQVPVGSELVEGVVLGTEGIRQSSEAGTAMRYKLVLLADGGNIRPIELLSVERIKILDEEVQKDLTRMMQIYAKARYADRKTVHLQCRGEGKREIRAGYIIETPIWKTSYRLLLDGNTPLLQGWAIVENRTDEDWDEVNLSLVAGSPMSLIKELNAERKKVDGEIEARLAAYSE